MYLATKASLPVRLALPTASDLFARIGVCTYGIEACRASASLWETSSLQASLQKTYMIIVSQKSKQLVSLLFII